MSTETGPNPLDLVYGLVPAQLVHVAARLELGDHMDSTPRSSGELATATGAHAPSLYRTLRALACLGLVAETAPDRFTLLPAGEALRSKSLQAMIRLLCHEETWRSWGKLEHSVRTGEPAWEQVTGMSHFDYLAQHPEHAQTFNDAMVEYVRAVAPSIVERCDLGRFATVADIGGGDGSLLAAMLTAHPHLYGTLVELPAAAQSAAPVLDGAGVTARATVVADDAFSATLPEADAHVLKSVLHDWDDHAAVRLLERCRAALGDKGVLLVVEPVLPEHLTSPNVIGVVMSDINMLVNTGGRERTEGEFRAVFKQAGFDLVGVEGRGTDFCVLEGHPVR